MGVCLGVIADIIEWTIFTMSEVPDDPYREVYRKSARRGRCDKEREREEIYILKNKRIKKRYRGGGDQEE